MLTDKQQNLVYLVQTSVNLGKAKIITSDPLEEYRNYRGLMEHFGVYAPRKPKAETLENFEKSKMAFQELAVIVMNITRFHENIGQGFGFALRETEVEGKLDITTVKSIHEKIEYLSWLYRLGADDMPKNPVVNDLGFEQYVQAKYILKQRFVFAKNLEEFFRLGTPGKRCRNQFIDDYGLCSNCSQFLERFSERNIMFSY